MTRSPRSVTATAGVDQGAAGGEGGVGGRRNKLRRRTPKKAMGNQTVTRRLQFSGVFDFDARRLPRLEVQSM